MTVTVNRSRNSYNLSCKITNSSGALFDFSKSTGYSLRDSAGLFTFDRVLALEDYSLTLASGNLDIDLYDLGTLDVGSGPGRDNLGLAQANAKICAILIENQSTSAGDLRIDNTVANAWTGILPASATLDLDAGSYMNCVFGATGKPVTDASSHILRLSAQGDDCTINVVFFSSQT
ncbi:MAG: hypothetical protein ACR2NF_06520 [Pirellulales bacterium]